MVDYKLISKVLYITGRGGNLHNGLAVYLSSIVDEFDGVAVSSNSVGLTIINCTSELNIP